MYAGTGSHARRKFIMNTALGQESLFENLMRAFRARLGQLAESTQGSIQTAATAYLDAVKDTFDIVRSDNVVLEGEREPIFRNRVGDEVRVAREVVERLQRTAER